MLALIEHIKADNENKTKVKQRDVKYVSVGYVKTDGNNYTKTAKTKTK